MLRLERPEDQLGWLIEHLDDLPGSGIIYTLTVAVAEDVAALLRASGYDVVAYSGRTDTADRLETEAALVENRVKAVVATSALGMGFDKPDLGFVVHVGAPPSPIAYYQQVGRAGRSVERADVLLLPGREDEAVWRYFASLAFPDEGVVRVALAALDRVRPTSTATLNDRRAAPGTPRDDAQGARRRRAVRRVSGGWVATGEPWAYDRERSDTSPRRRLASSKRCAATHRRFVPDGDVAPRPRRSRCRALRALRRVRRAMVPDHGVRARHDRGPGGTRSARCSTSRSAPRGRPAWPHSASTGRIAGTNGH